MQEANKQLRAAHEQEANLEANKELKELKKEQKKELKEKRKEIDELRKANEDINKQLQEANRATDKKTKKNKTLKKEKENLETQKISLDSEKLRAEIKYETIAQQIAQLELKNNAMHVQLHDAKEELNYYKTYYQQMMKEFNQQQNQTIFALQDRQETVPNTPSNIYVNAANPTPLKPQVKPMPINKVGFRPPQNVSTEQPTRSNTNTEPDNTLLPQQNTATQQQTEETPQMISSIIENENNEENDRYESENEEENKTTRSQQKAKMSKEERNKAREAEEVNQKKAGTNPFQTAEPETSDEETPVKSMLENDEGVKRLQVELDKRKAVLLDRQLNQYKTRKSKDGQSSSKEIETEQEDHSSDTEDGLNLVKMTQRGDEIAMAITDDQLTNTPVASINHETKSRSNPIRSSRKSKPINKEDILDEFPVYHVNGTRQLAREIYEHATKEYKYRCLTCSFEMPSKLGGKRLTVEDRHKLFIEHIINEDSELHNHNLYARRDIADHDSKTCKEAVLLTIDQECMTWWQSEEKRGNANRKMPETVEIDLQMPNILNIQLTRAYQDDIWICNVCGEQILLIAEKKDAKNLRDIKNHCQKHTDQRGITYWLLDENGNTHKYIANEIHASTTWKKGNKHVPDSFDEPQENMPKCKTKVIMCSIARDEITGNYSCSLCERELLTRRVTPEPHRMMASHLAEYHITRFPKAVAETLVFHDTTTEEDLYYALDYIGANLRVYQFKSAN